MPRPSIVARAPWSAASLPWTQGGALWLTLAAKDVAWVDAKGALIPQPPTAVRTVDELVIAGGNEPRAPTGEAATAMVDPAVVATLRALPFGAGAAGAPPVPAPAIAPSETAAIDGEMLDQLRASYRNATPFAGKSITSAATPAPSVGNTPFRRPAPTAPYAPRPVAQALQAPAPWSPRPPAPPPPAPPPPPATTACPVLPALPAPPAQPAPHPASAPSSPSLARPDPAAARPSQGSLTSSVDPEEVRALREAHATPFRRLLPTERKGTSAPAPGAAVPGPPASPTPPDRLGATGVVPDDVVAALRAEHAPVPFRRKPPAPLEPFSSSWSEAFLCALKAPAVPSLRVDFHARAGQLSPSPPLL